MRFPPWKNQTIWTGDNLDIMRGMNSESVDLIYLDPPFNSNANYAAPIGSKAAGAEFKDIWTLEDIDIAWLDLIESKHPKLNRVIQAAMTDSDKSYLIYMAIRLLEMKRLLKPHGGGIYLHCDPTMSHYLKLVMDSIFGRRNFRNEIVWCYRKMPNKIRGFQKNHDLILFYSRTEDYCFNVIEGEMTEGSRKTFESGMRRGYNANNSKKMVTIFDWDKYRQAVKLGVIPGDLKPREFKGGNPPEKDWWEIKILGGPGNKERTGYRTQKPLDLLRRIIEASSNKDDMVLDPFCGCATTCIAAEDLQRQWVGIDIGEKAAELVQMRMKENLGMFYNGVHRTDIPTRTDLGILPHYKTHKQTLYGFQGGHCNGCAEHFKPHNLTVDHIIPRSGGGTDHIGNLQLLCGYCNSVKGNRGMEYLIARLENGNTRKGY
ncbi:MAG: DNA methyltransferase [Rhodobacteraceae bacterium]|nr:DNA methyltransferase [Paracoccaceae bacterium]